MTALTAAAIIAQIGLEPHPEGGHYRETFRDTRTDATGRAASTAIYFLLARGERMARFSSVEDLRGELDMLIGKRPPLVQEIGRGPGQR